MSEDPAAKELEEELRFAIKTCSAMTVYADALLKAVGVGSECVGTAPDAARLGFLEACRACMRILATITPFAERLDAISKKRGFVAPRSSGPAN